VVVQEAQTAKPKVYVQHLGDVIEWDVPPKKPVQSIAHDKIAPTEYVEPKQYPMKHGLKDDVHGLWWNAHCQHWQKQKPFPLGWACEKAYGKGTFVHGYHAPMPHGGSTGTGVGWWHADKQKWLLWEPDPLPEASKVVVTKTTYVPKEIHHDGEKWVEVPVKKPKQWVKKKPAKKVADEFMKLANELAFKHTQED
jgi:hypothetical protein